VLFSFRGQATHTSAVSLARTLGLAMHTKQKYSMHAVEISFSAVNAKCSGPSTVLKAARNSFGCPTLQFKPFASSVPRRQARSPWPRFGHRVA
jgi:hypothetical protein